VSARRLPIGPVPIDTGTVELVRVPGDPSGVTVYVNGAESSHVDLAEPGRLEFEYMQQMMATVDATVPPGTPLRAVHLGGAACTLARAVDARRPGSRQIAVEIDGALAAHVRRWFALPRAPRLRIRVGDARDTLATLRPGSQDVVVRDVFSGRSVPEHLRTREMVREVARVLAPAGIYVLNCADVPPLLDARREVATLATTFPHVAVITDPAVLKGRRYGNLVLLARARPLPAGALARDLRALAFPATILADADAARFAGTALPFIDPPPPA